MRRVFTGRAVVVALMAGLLTACASKPIINATGTYKDAMADALSSLDTAISAHIDTYRERVLLEWRDSPREIVKANGVDELTYGPSLSALRVWVCQPSGTEARLALQQLAGYGEGLTSVAKAPADGLVPALNAIGSYQARLNKIREDAIKAGSSTTRKSIEECMDRLMRLYESKFEVPIEKFPIDAKAPAAQAVTPFLDFVFSAYDAMTVTAGLIEQQLRADLIREYMKSNVNRVEEALAILSADPAKSPKGAPTLSLQATVNDRMRFHLTRSLLEVQRTRIATSATERRESAAAAAEQMRLYSQLAPMDIDNDIVQPMRKAQQAFVAAANSNGNFDDFMQAITDLRNTRDNWIDARDKYRAWRD